MDGVVGEGWHLGERMKGVMDEWSSAESEGLMRPWGDVCMPSSFMSLALSEETCGGVYVGKGRQVHSTSCPYDSIDLRTEMRCGSDQPDLAMQFVTPDAYRQTRQASPVRSSRSTGAKAQRTERTVGCMIHIMPSSRPHSAELPRPPIPSISPRAASSSAAICPPRSVLLRPRRLFERSS